jgi:hypothetical protein
LLTPWFISTYLLLKLPLLEKGEVPLIAEDDVVKQRNSQEFSRAFDTVCYFAVLAAGFKAPAWMVMGYDDGSCPLLERN